MQKTEKFTPFLPSILQCSVVDSFKILEQGQADLFDGISERTEYTTHVSD
jgi:hypothetical protein